MSVSLVWLFLSRLRPVLAREAYFTHVYHYRFPQRALGKSRTTVKSRWEHASQFGFYYGNDIIDHPNQDSRVKRGAGNDSPRWRVYIRRTPGIRGSVATLLMLYASPPTYPNSQCTERQTVISHSPKGSALNPCVT